MTLSNLLDKMILAGCICLGFTAVSSASGAANVPAEHWIRG